MNEYPDWLDRKYRKPLLKEATAAELLGISISTIRFYRKIKKADDCFPNPTYVKGSPRYYTHEIIKYLEVKKENGLTKMEV